MITCNMCGESMAPTNDSDCPYGLVDAKVEGGYESPALQDMSVYKFSFCEYCLDHIFQQCVNPPKGWEYSFHRYEPIEEKIKDEKTIKGFLYEYHERILAEKARRDTIRSNKQAYEPTSKEMLDYERSWRSFGNSEIAPTKEYQEKMKALRDETVKLFNLLSDEEKAELIYHHESYDKKRSLPPEQWHDHHVPSDDKIVSQETHDAYEDFCNVVESFEDRRNKRDDPEYEDKKAFYNKKVQESFNLLTPEAKKVSQGLYNIVFNIKDPVWEKFWEDSLENFPKDEIVPLCPKPDYPNE